MRQNMEQRACDLARYMIENGATVRSAAKKFGVSKSTVHKDLSDRLPLFNRPLYLEVRKIMDANKAERHIRGGLATQEKYRRQKQK
ncbi:MAG: sporulation transcriptional regulator SpoIIID [Clostridia bacterium]|nr:sporulation transcriptional regulator SpoIIID [Clostridia bacterium]